MDAIVALRQALGVDSGVPGVEIKKAYTASLGLTGINLEPAVKVLLPIYNPLRRRLPVDRPQVGSDSIRYRALLGYPAGLADSQFFGVPFGDPGPENQHNPVTFQIPYYTLALQDKVEWEAIQFARGFDDAMATATQAALVRLLRAEEMTVLGANRDPLPAPARPTVTEDTSQTAGNIGTTQITVKVTALTFQGYLAGSQGGSSAVGESVASSQATITPAAATHGLIISWPAVPGAVAYNVYLNNKYALTTTLTKVEVLALPASGNQPPASDTTANPLVAEGIIAWCEKPQLYGQAIDRTGLFLDAQGNGLTFVDGGIAEFDQVLEALWRRWQISPTLIVGSAAAVRAITAKLVKQVNSLQYRIDITSERGGFTGGVILANYINKFAASVEGLPSSIPVMAHPYMPDGTILFLSERIPYPYARESRGFALDVNTPYTYFPLARTQRSFPFTIFLTQTLKCYLPTTHAAIVGFDPAK